MNWIFHDECMFLLSILLHSLKTNWCRKYHLIYVFVGTKLFVAYKEDEMECPSPLLISLLQLHPQSSLIFLVPGTEKHNRILKEKNVHLSIEVLYLVMFLV